MNLLLKPHSLRGHDPESLLKASDRAYLGPLVARVWRWGFWGISEYAMILTRNIKEW